MAFAREDYVWKERGWTAEIIRDDEGGSGWAVAMTPDGADEPVYTAPWTMGRNKKDPKPMTTRDFLVWIKSASEFLERTQRQLGTRARKSLDLTDPGGAFVRIIFDVQERGEAVGVLTAENSVGLEIARAEIDPLFRLTRERAEAWIDAGYPERLSEDSDLEEDSDGRFEEESYEDYEEVSYEPYEDSDFEDGAVQEVYEEEVYRAPDLEEST